MRKRGIRSVLFAGLGFQVVYLIVALLAALDVHEFCHAWMADRLGDPNPRNMGRLSLNPLAHLDPWGTLMLLLVGLGWGKPVRIDAERLRYGPKKGMALVGAAGPLSNFLLAALLAIPLRLHLIPFAPRLIGGFPISYGEFFRWTIWLSLGLAIFNLIPLSPLDGSRLWTAFLPTRWFYVLARYERYGIALLFLLVLAERFVQTGILGAILFPPINFFWWRLVGMSPPFYW